MLEEQVSTIRKLADGHELEIQRWKADPPQRLHGVQALHKKLNEPERAIADLKLGNKRLRANAQTDGNIITIRWICPN